MWLEVAAGYGAYRALCDLAAWAKGKELKTAERQAARDYGLVPVKRQPGVYVDPETQQTTRMAQDQHGNFHPTSVLDFEVVIRGRQTFF